MDNYQDKGLVSIIMLSHGDGTYVVDSVKSILAQTYQNWELLFVAKTDDETLEPLSSLREEDVKIQKRAGKVLTDSYSNSRIKASFIVGEDNDTPRRNSALANAQGRWIAKSALWRSMAMRSPILNMGLLTRILTIADL